jgi:hypothetical protein
MAVELFEVEAEVDATAMLAASLISHGFFGRVCCGGFVVIKSRYHSNSPFGFTA